MGLGSFASFGVQPNLLLHWKGINDDIVEDEQKLTTEFNFII